MNKACQHGFSKKKAFHALHEFKNYDRLQGRSQNWNIEGANLLIPTIRRGHTLLMSNISNEIMRFYM